jgi:hypothetical protein
LEKSLIKRARSETSTSHSKAHSRISIYRCNKYTGNFYPFPPVLVGWLAGWLAGLSPLRDSQRAVWVGRIWASPSCSVSDAMRCGGPWHCQRTGKEGSGGKEKGRPRQRPVLGALGGRENCSAPTSQSQSQSQPGRSLYLGAACGWIYLAVAGRRCGLRLANHLLKARACAAGCRISTAKQELCTACCRWTHSPLPEFAA